MSQPNKPPCIAMIGATISGNRGAEAMVVTTVGMIRRRFPDARFVLLSYFPERDSTLVDDHGIQVYDAGPKALVLLHFPFALLAGVFRMIGIRLPDAMLPGIVRSLRDCDALADLMGIAYADGRTKFLPFNVLSNLPAMLLGVPVVRLSQAVGPFESPLTRIVSKFMLKRCVYTAARGEITASHLRELGLPDERWSLAADLAFIYEPGFSLSDENAAPLDELTSRLEAKRAADRRIIGIGPSMVVNRKFEKQGRDYAEFMANITRQILDRDCDVVFIPNATREHTDSGHNNDLPVLQAIRSRLSDVLDTEQQHRIDWLDFDANTSGIRRAINGCDVLLTSRFHAMIGALSLGVPVLVLGWSHKYEEVLASFGLERFAVDFADADADLPGLLDELLDRNDAIRIQIREALPAVQASSRTQFDIFDKLCS